MRNIQAKKKQVTDKLVFTRLQYGGSAFFLRANHDLLLNETV